MVTWLDQNHPNLVEMFNMDYWRFGRCIFGTEHQINIFFLFQAYLMWFAYSLDLEEIECVSKELKN